MTSRPALHAAVTTPLGRVNPEQGCFLHAYHHDSGTLTITTVAVLGGIVMLRLFA